MTHTNSPIEPESNLSKLIGTGLGPSVLLASREYTGRSVDGWYELAIQELQSLPKGYKTAVKWINMEDTRFVNVQLTEDVYIRELDGDAIPVHGFYLAIEPITHIPIDKVYNGNIPTSVMGPHFAAYTPMSSSVDEREIRKETRQGAELTANCFFALLDRNLRHIDTETIEVGTGEISAAMQLGNRIFCAAYEALREIVEKGRSREQEQFGYGTHETQYISPDDYAQHKKALHMCDVMTAKHVAWADQMRAMIKELNPGTHEVFSGLGNSDEAQKIHDDFFENLKRRGEY